MLKLIITGNLDADPQERVVNTESGQQSVCNFPVAVNQMVKGKKTAQYFQVACWNKQAENAMKYLTKGSKVLVTGKVSARAYIDMKTGAARAVMDVLAEDIEYLSSRQDKQQSQSQPSVSEDDGFMHIPDGIDEQLPFA